MLKIVPALGQLTVGLLATALAMPCVVAAAIERPPAARVPRTVIAIASLWAVVFLEASVNVVIRLEHPDNFGPLVATAELSVAGAIWARRDHWRSRRRRWRR